MRFSTAGELTATIAHEINQPLGAILTNAETAQAILKSPNPDIAELDEIVSDILRDDRRATEVIRRMRTLLTKAPFELKSIDLNNVAQETIDNQRDMLKAYLVAEILGWTDAVADPAGAAALAVNTYGKDLGLDLAGQTEQATAQNELIVSADTKANGLFTLSEALQTQIIKALGDIGITIKAEDLFDLSMLNEIYADNPSLITG